MTNKTARSPKMDQAPDPCEDPKSSLGEFTTLPFFSRPISLWCLLGIAFLARIPAILFSQGFEFYDEQFQYIDPAYHLAFDGSWLTTEDFVEGIRSWLYPNALAEIFRWAKELGIDDPLNMMRFTRAVHAIISLIPIFALWKFAQWKGFGSKRAMLLFLSVCFFGTYSGVHPNSPAVAAGLSVAAVLFFHGPRFYPLLAGICCGLAFCGRFQDAFFGPILVVGGLFQKRPRASLLFCVGTIGPILLQGFHDQAIHGTFLYSPFRYVEFNMLEGKNADWGSEPIYYYLGLAAGVLFFLPPFMRSTWRHLMVGIKAMPLVFGAAVCYLVLHTIPAHKAARFVLPALFLLTIVLSYSLFDEERTATWQSRWHRRVYLGIHTLAFLFLSLFFFNRGPIEAALHLRARADFTDNLIMVGGSGVSIGGHYYLGRKSMRVTSVAREDLRTHLEKSDLTQAIYIMVGNKRPLDLQTVVSSGYRIEMLGAFADWPELKRRSRRWVYRVTKPF